MDLSKIPTKDLEYIKAGKIDKVSTATLEELSRQSGVSVAPSPSVVAPVPYSPRAEVLRSAAQGATFGFADELEAALRTGKISGEEYETLRNQLRGQQAQFAQDRPFVAGSTNITGALAAPAAAFVNPVTRGGGIVTDVLLGSGMGALQGAGTAESDTGEAALMGGLFGGGTAGVMSGGGRLLAPNVRSEAAALRQEGIPLTPGSAFGGRIQQIEQSAESLPIAGRIITGAREKQFEKFNEAAYNRVLKNINPDLKVPKGLQGRDAYSFVEKAIQDQYNNVVPNLRVVYTNKVQSGFDAIKNRYAKGKLSEADKNQLNQLIDSYADDLRNRQVITGQSVQGIKQDLREMAATYSSGVGSQKILGNALKDLEGFYMNVLKNQNPTYASDLTKADSAFRDFVRVQTAMSKTRGSEGVFTPAQLEAAVRQTDKSARKGAFARGAAPMQDFSGVATSVLGTKVPDSGTAGRGMTAAALTGGLSMVDPRMAALSAITSLPYFNLGEKLLFAPRPAAFSEAVQRARAASPFAVPGLLGLTQ
jgi:hypothetical protein